MLVAIAVGGGGKVAVNTLNYTVVTSPYPEVTFTAVSKSADKGGYKMKTTVDIRADHPSKSTGVNAPLRYRLKYYSSDKDSKTSFKLNMHMGFVEIVEFVPTDPLLGFQVGVDTPVSTSLWSENSWQFSTIFTDGYNYWFNVSDVNNTFTVTPHIAAGDFAVNGQNYAPDEVKTDILIQNYPYTTAGTYLALRIRLQSVMKLTQNKTKSEAIYSNPGLGGMMFAWLPTLTIDGNPCNVIASPLNKTTDDTTDPDYVKGESAFHYYFTFPAVHPGVIQWDPTVAIWGSASSVTASLLLLVAALLALLL
jgi:hypothetical protein